MIDRILSYIFCIAVQIGFQQNSYTVSERNESVRVCVEMTTGNYTVPVTRAVLYTGSAESMYTILSHIYTSRGARLLCMCMCKAGLSNCFVSQLKIFKELNS